MNKRTLFKKTPNSEQLQLLKDTQKSCLQFSDKNLILYLKPSV